MALARDVAGSTTQPSRLVSVVSIEDMDNKFTVTGNMAFVYATRY